MVHGGHCFVDLSPHSPRSFFVYKSRFWCPPCHQAFQQCTPPPSPNSNPDQRSIPLLSNQISILAQSLRSAPVPFSHSSRPWTIAPPPACPTALHPIILLLICTAGDFDLLSDPRALTCNHRFRRGVPPSVLTAASSYSIKADAQAGRRPGVRVSRLSRRLSINSDSAATQP